MVIDASVLIDMFLTSRPRHCRALKLVQLIKKSGLTVIVPMHAILEVKCAIDNERQTPTHGDLHDGLFTEESPLNCRCVPIDKTFIHEYVDLSVPHIRAGDLPYVLIAKKHKCPLVTEDHGQYDVAKRAGVATYNIDEYLELTSGVNQG